MEKILVDSSYVIDYLRGYEYTKLLMNSVQNRELEAYISVVTIFELYTGAMLSANSKKKFEDIETLLSWFQIIDINKEMVLSAAKIYVDLRKRGFTTGIQDILIAASSISKNMKLLTNNKKHFQSIVGLNLE